MNIEQKDPVLEEYAGLAAEYDRRWSFYIEATIRETLARLDPRQNDKLLDIGCGTGSLLQALSLLSLRLELAGVDSSPEMLGVAREKLGRSVDLKLAGAGNLPFPNGVFDLVVSTSVFHYLRDPERAMNEIERVLKPSGRVVITDWCDDYLSCRICGMVLRVLGRAPVQVYTRAQCEELLARSHFEAVQVERYKINWLWGLMTARGEKRAG